MPRKQTEIWKVKPSQAESLGEARGTSKGFIKGENTLNKS